MKHISRRSGGVLRGARAAPEPLLDTLSVYSWDTVLHRAQGEQVGGGKRGTVQMLSRASRARLVLAARNSEPLPAFATFTYPAEFPMDGRRVKRHLDALLSWLRRRGIRGLWWLEFQRRGAPHLHMALTGGAFGEVVQGEREQLLPSDLLRSVQFDLRLAWFRIVGSGDSKHLQHGVKVEAWRSGRYGRQEYVAKESAKWVQKEPPAGFTEVGRFWGKFGGVKVEHREVFASTEELAKVVRVARGAEKANRRRQGLPPRSDGGRVGFTAYGAGGAVERYLSEEGLSS